MLCTRRSGWGGASGRAPRVNFMYLSISPCMVLSFAQNESEKSNNGKLNFKSTSILKLIYN